MKSFKQAWGIGFVLSLLLVPIGARSSTVVYHEGMDEEVRAVGPNGLIVFAETSTAKPLPPSSGFRVVECSITGEVIKGNKDYQAGPNQTVVFRSVPVDGFTPCTDGMKGLFMIFGKGKLGLQSFLPNADYRVTDKDGQQVTSRALVVKDQAFRGKLLQAQPRMKNLILDKASVTGEMAPGGAVTALDLKDSARVLSQEIWGTTNAQK